MDILGLDEKAAKLFCKRKKMFQSIKSIWNSAKFLKILPNFSLSYISEMFIGNTILIVSESFSELKFLVPILVRCG